MWVYIRVLLYLLSYQARLAVLTLFQVMTNIRA